jgi:hypothetical protein
VQVLLATLCDFAADYQGKLCILGSFDTLCSQKFPVEHPQCSFALRLCFDNEDSGNVALTIRALGPEDENIIPPFPVNIDATMPNAFTPFVTRNIVLNLQRLKLEKPGLYRFIVERNDEEVIGVPLRVMLFDKQGKPPGAYG